MARERVYRPGTDDVGSVLKCDVVAVDTTSAFPELGKSFSVLTARVRPAPTPPVRRNIALKPSKPTANGRFTALTYNILADIYANMVRCMARNPPRVGPVHHAPELPGRWKRKQARDTSEGRLPSVMGSL